MSGEVSMPRMIVCAANSVDGKIILGVRHYDPIMRLSLSLLDDAYGPMEDASIIQGFIDNKGIFLTREEAWLVAKNAGQIKRRVGDDNGKLFSENLY